MADFCDWPASDLNDKFVSRIIPNCVLYTRALPDNRETWHNTSIIVGAKSCAGVSNSGHKKNTTRGVGPLTYCTGSHMAGRRRKISINRHQDRFSSTVSLATIVEL
ncbi:hypothetical protein BC936DRAFT_139811 [Jimgerdemannia flammicorona]|uniref:Uncharacterized protein n=1 Tax=Jimgerdemannia flammicorona TaxID=994334 RepID=A0A433DHC4_9FUNG|nr:hypothetical protein BC936DRAFT_139811 [Jimgerdemannia flammicorona]